LWWKQTGDALARLEKLTVFDLPQASTRALADLADRNMEMQITIQDGQIWISNDRASVQLEPEIRQASNAI
jgi:uncharacterized protein YaeQ